MFSLAVHRLPFIVQSVTQPVPSDRAGGSDG